MKPSESAPLIFAAVGDVHGRHREMVALVQARGVAPAFVLQAGDFECHRHDEDLASMAAPQKYRLLGDFHRFHDKELRYPWPVYFVGGNHECYGWLDRHPQGFSPAPGCHYLGRVGYRRIQGLGLLGLSGVYDGEALERPRPGPNELAGRSNKALVGFTDAEVEAAVEAEGVDVLLLHEWPEGVATMTPCACTTTRAFAAAARATPGPGSFCSTTARPWCSAATPTCPTGASWNGRTAAAPWSAASARSRTARAQWLCYAWTATQMVAPWRRSRHDRHR